MIGIIAVLLVAALPAVTSMSKSSARKSAISGLLGIIDQARAQAIQDGKSTYVVFPDKLPSNNNPSMAQRYSYRSYAIFEDDLVAGTPKQLTPWRSLPTGVSLRIGSLNYLANTISFPFTPLPGTNGPFPFLKFTANGEIDPSTTRNPNNTTGTIQFGVFEGFVDGGGAERSTNKTNFTESVEVQRLTGRARRM